jgi:hypothetical protein
VNCQRIWYMNFDSTLGTKLKTLGIICNGENQKKKEKKKERIENECPPNHNKKVYIYNILTNKNNTKLNFFKMVRSVL